uniref:G protein-coupled receptor n=1 Tax=Panagrolaimus sp. JU765 TaxID=591449 RepID=A0AC34RKU0_9BILA
MLAALAYASWTLYTFWPNQEKWIEKSRLLRADSIYSEGIPNFVVASIDEWPLRILFIYAYVLVVISYGLTIFCNVKVWRHLEAMESQMSIQNRDAQKQINRTLIIQALIPGIVVLTPIALAVTLAFLHTNIPGIGLLVSFLLSIIPLANPLLTLIVVKNYRQTIITTFKILWKTKLYENRSTVSTISRGINPIGLSSKSDDNRLTSSSMPLPPP